jgi:hemolysin activation/secretion protein
LRYTDRLPFRFASSFTIYGFYDVGIIYLRSPNGDKDSDSAASAGLGLRIQLGPHVSGFAELAKPLTRDVSAKENRDARGYGGVSIRF